MQDLNQGRAAFGTKAALHPLTTGTANECSSLAILGIDETQLAGRPIRHLHEFRRARQNIYRRGESCDDVGIIRDGWAFRFNQLSDGRRQILSILLPGDLITATSLFQNQLEFSVQALTDVHYCRINRSDLRLRLLQPTYLDTIARILIAERKDSDDQLIDLGQRHADERIAGLILRLRARFQVRGEVEHERFPLPLRQQHIADITGLTAVHVSRVLSIFRKNGYIGFYEGFITLHNVAELQRIGELK